MDSEAHKADGLDHDGLEESREPPTDMDMDIGQSDDDLAERNNHSDKNNGDDNLRTVNGKQSDPVEPTTSTTNIVQVTNIAPSVTLEQLKTLFGYLAEINHIELYVYDQNSDNNLKVCFVEFANPSSVLLAQHLTNTVFIDRTLVVLPYNKPKIPDKETVLETLDRSHISEFNHGVVTQALTGVNGIPMISTTDPRLTALGLTQYPQLPANTDPTRVEEIRRTVYIGNLDSSVPPDEVMKFFNDIGEVKYIRMAGDDTQPTRFAFVEFTHQASIVNALQKNGAILGSRALKINHSNNAIVKPVPKNEIEDSLSRARGSSQDYLGRDRHHSPRNDRYHRDRHRDRDNRYRREYSRSHRSRSRDHERRRSRSRDRLPSRRDHSPRDRGSRKRSRSRDLKRRKSRSSERSRSKHHHKSSRR